MKKIPLTQGKFALVDDEDYKALSAYKWYACKSIGKMYARRNIRVDGKQRSLLMHIAIMGKLPGKEIDHLSGDGLNNQRHNLRHCTHTENMNNQGPRARNFSGYKGVSWDKESKKWRVQIAVGSKKFLLGHFTCLIKAAKVYDKKAKELHGEFVWLNFN